MSPRVTGANRHEWKEGFRRACGHHRPRHSRRRSCGREGPPIVLFEYQPGRGGEYPKRFLGEFKGHLQVDGHGDLQPAIDIFRGTTQEVGTPAFTSSFIEDVYLAPNDLHAVPGDEFATLQIVVQPLVSWLWIGGAIVAGGAVLAAIPGRRRRPTDPSTVAFPELLDEDLVGQGVGR